MAALVCLIAATPALAFQQQPAPDSANRRPAAAPRSLDPVRVTGQRTSAGYAAPQSTTATRTDLPLRDTPRAVSIVTKKLIADQAMQGMADVVRYVPGVSMGAGEGHRDAPTIRGNNTTADFFVDGARDDAQYLRDLYNAERIEILKGPEALLFGRGGGGGIINRVTKQASWEPVLALTTEGGSFDHKRATLDAGRGFDARVAGRMTSMYERSGGFRDAAAITRYGVNPHLTVLAGPHTALQLGYELFDDRRNVDRGVPSYAGAPVRGSISTFFGNPDVNRASARVNLASAALEHRADNGLVFRNHTTWADYDKFYQNTVPGGVDATGTRVTLSAYNHAIARRNLINVTDLTRSFATGPVRHTLLVGLDLTRQHTDQVRLTGYYGDTATAYVAPLSDPTITTPVVFRPSPTDASNVSVATDVAAYVQDQIALTPAWLLVAGVRHERFDMTYHNNRGGADLSRSDQLVSPRAGLVFKPAVPFSVYASYGVSYLPSSGDQFTSLTVTTATLEPERFTNREIGVKWDVRGVLALSAAAYRLDRTNTMAPDPDTPGLVVQTGSQRTTGWELGATGSPTRDWQIAAGVASQRAVITSTTRSAARGATVPLVPHTTVSLWNRYQLVPRLGVAVGLIRQSAMFAAIDNSVTLPSFFRTDAASYVTLTRGLRAQINVENVFDARYFATSHGNNNIMPGAPRTVRLGLVASR
jgi:catecholate siderophore receptor